MKTIIFLLALLAQTATAATQYVRFPVASGGVTTYPTVGALPASAADGATAVTLDTHGFYIYDLGTVAWVLQTASTITGVTGPGSSVDSQIMLWNGTGGNTAKAASGTGIAHVSSGVFSASATNLASADVTGVLPVANIAGPAAPALSGYLSSTDWNTFNGKQAAGSYLTALTGDVTAAGPGSAAATIANQAVTNAKIANSTIDLTAKVTGRLPQANLASMVAGIDRYVDASYGDDGTGDGSVQRPWHTLQYACTQVDTAPAFNVIHMSGGANEGTDASTGPITCPPFVSITSVTPIYHIDQPITISDVDNVNLQVSLNNVYLGSTFTWVQNDNSNLQLQFLNVVMQSGLLTFKQSGAGMSGSAAFMTNGTLGGGIDIQASQLTATNFNLYGPLTYEDSGASFLILFSGDLFGSITLNGGITAWFTGALSDGNSLTTVTTGSGTPTIYSDSGSIPPTITGPNTFIPFDYANHTGYNPTTSADWSSAPALVGPALDNLASTRARLSGDTMTGNLVLPSVQMNTGASKPTCDVTKRGMLWVEQGGAGVTDKLLNCLKSIADTYSWVQVSTGG